MQNKKEIQFTEPSISPEVLKAKDLSCTAKLIYGLVTTSGTYNNKSHKVHSWKVNTLAEVLNTSTQNVTRITNILHRKKLLNWMKETDTYQHSCLKKNLGILE